MMTDDDDEWDYWLNASDEEVAREEARLDSQMAELERRLDAMPIAKQVAHHRRFLLIDILENRRRIRDPKLNTIEFISQMWRESLRRKQVRLAKLRTWRATGTYPGSA